MSDKSFKVKSGLQIPGVTSANILTTDSSGNVSSSSTLAIANGGTGQTTATNAINALLPLQTSNDNYFLQTSGISPQWSKVFYQAIKDNGTTVTPRGYLNIVGGTFSDDSLNDITTLDLSDKASLSSANTFTVGPQTINTGLSSNAGLIIKGAVSQNSGGALTQWLSSTNSLLASVNGAGRIYSSVSLTAGSISVSLGALTAISTSASIIGAVIRGAASQTANLQEWQDSSGNIQAKITKDGVIVSGTSSGSASGIQTGSASFTGVSWNGISNPAGATTIPSLVVKGITSQSANLQEWQDSSGTILSRISSSGILYAISGLVTDTIWGIASNGAKSLWPDNTTGSITIGSNLTSGSLNLGTSGLQTGAINIGNGAGTNNRTINIGNGATSGTTSITIGSSSGATSNITLNGNVTFNGTTTNINTTNLVVEDKNIVIADVTTPTDTTADGAGITIKGATDKTFNWVQSTAAFTSSEPISAPAFKSAGTAVSSNITLVSGYRYFVDTTAARTLTLPASPSLGDEIQIYDASNSALTNNITVASNSNKIQGSVQNLIIDSNAATVYLTYTGSTYGWAVN